MISIEGKVSNDIDYVLDFFEIILKKIVYIIPDIDSREDCKQELRLIIWKFFGVKGKIYSEPYIIQRLKWDTINFINRDSIYNFSKNSLFVDNFFDFTCSSLVLKEDSLEDLVDIEDSTKLAELVEKAKRKMTKKQYEALMLYLSCEKNKTIKQFYGLENKNLTRYYINLAAALDFIREELKNERTE